MTETLPSSPGNILSKNMLIIKCGELKWNKMGANIKTLVYYFAVFNLLLVKCRYKRTFSLLDIDLLWFSPPNHTVMHTFALHLVEATLAAVTAMTLRIYCMLISALHICTLCLSPFFFENCTAFAKTFPPGFKSLLQKKHPHSTMMPLTGYMVWMVCFCCVMFGLPHTVWYDCQNAQSGFTRPEHSFFCVWQLSSCLQPRLREPKVRVKLHCKNNVSHLYSFWGCSAPGRFTTSAISFYFYERSYWTLRGIHCLACNFSSVHHLRRP